MTETIDTTKDETTSRELGAVVERWARAATHLTTALRAGASADELREGAEAVEWDVGRIDELFAALSEDAQQVLMHTFPALSQLLDLSTELAKIARDAAAPKVEA